MAVILGVDTGGTYTDSVLIDASDRTVVRKAKSYTTKEDLLKGILASIRKLRWTSPEEITLVCLSTTIATNAVVEGKGGRTGLVYMGRRIVSETLPATVVRQATGQLDIKGREIERIREEELREIVGDMIGKVDAIAVSGFASVRNPAHELAVKQIAREMTDMPVVCAHELSASLGYHDRTVTAILNASLIPNIKHLIEATRDAMKQLGIKAPCMVVCGDGNLILDEAAMDRPIETVLSGPAASVVGGRFLTGIRDALVVDVGGTTTDIANVIDGRVKITASGAVVGGWRTQLRAAEISTHGIGGDSWIQYDKMGSLQVSSERVIPLFEAGLENPGIIEEWRMYQPPREHEIFFGEVTDCYRLGVMPEHPDYDENKLAGLLVDGPHSRFYLSEQMGRDYDKMDFSAYVRQGLLQRCSLTPTDLIAAMPVLLPDEGNMNLERTEAAASGNHPEHDTANQERFRVRETVPEIHTEAAGMRDSVPRIRTDAAGMPDGNADAAAEAIRIMAHRTASEPASFLRKCTELVQERMRIACLQSTADFENSAFDFSDPLVQFILQREHPLLQVDLKLKKPIVAIGAPVRTWFPGVAEKLGTKLVIPEHAEVANAIGAAVGEVVAFAEVLIRPDQYHKGYLVYTPQETVWFETLTEAESSACEAAEAFVRDKLAKTGGASAELIETENRNRCNPESGSCNEDRKKGSGNSAVSVRKHPVYTEQFGTGERIFIEEKVTATAIAAPRWAEQE